MHISTAIIFTRSDIVIKYQCPASFLTVSNLIRLEVELAMTKIANLSYKKHQATVRIS